MLGGKEIESKTNKEQIYFILFGVDQKTILLSCLLSMLIGLGLFSCMITGCSSSNDDSDIFVELPIYNEGNFSQQSGAIFIDIHVGGNPYRVLFDTGSSTLALNSFSCEDCEFYTGPYTLPVDGVIPCYSNLCPAPDESEEGSCISTCWNDTQACEFCIEYDPGGYLGRWGIDDIRLGDSMTGSWLDAQVQLGEIMKLEGSSTQPPQELSGLGGFADGVFGAAGSAQNDVLNNPNIAPKTVLQHMGDKYLGGSYMPFALCFNATQGLLRIGRLSSTEDLPFSDPSSLRKLPIPEYADGFYGFDFTDLRVNGISIGGTPDDFRASNAVWDTGTSGFVLQETINNPQYSRFVRALCNSTSSRTLRNEICNDEAFNDGCLENITAADIISLAKVDLALVINDQTITFPASRLFFESLGRPGDLSNNGEACPEGVFYNTVQKDSNYAIIGSYFMRYYSWYFDLENEVVWMANSIGCQLHQCR